MVTVTVALWSVTRIPSSGMEIGAWSVGGSSTRPTVRSSWVTVTTIVRTLSGTWRIALSDAGFRPSGTGKLRKAVSRCPKNANRVATPMSDSNSVGDWASDGGAVAVWSGSACAKGASQ